MLQPPALSKRESQIMEVISALGEASATKIMSGMPQQLNRATIRTFLKILEVKGHLTHRREGKEFVYVPVHSRSGPMQVLNVFFEGAGKAPATASGADVLRISESTGALVESGATHLHTTHLHTTPEPNLESPLCVTAREKEVLGLLAEGKTNKGIAQRLHISARTVEAHRWLLMKKLKMHSVAELTKYAIRSGLASL